MDKADVSLAHRPGLENGEEGSADVSLERRFFKPHTLISFVLAFAILYFLMTRINIDIGQTWQRIKTVNLSYFALAFVVYYASFPIRGWRWRVLLRNVGFQEKAGVQLPSVAGLAEIVFLSWFANCIIPAKLGDAYRGYLLKRRASVSFSKTMGTVLAERMVDTVILFVLIALAGLRIFHGTVPDAVASMLLAGAGLVVVVIMALLIMWRFGGLVRRLVPKRFAGVYGRFEEGTFHSFQNLPLLCGLTVVIWLAEAGRLWLVMSAFGLPNVGVSVVVFVALAGSLLTTLPVTPAGLGIVESALVGLFILLNSLGALRGVDESLATSIAVLDRTISYWSLVFLGIVAYIVSKRSYIASKRR